MTLPQRGLSVKTHAAANQESAWDEESTEFLVQSDLIVSPEQSR